MTLTCTLEQRFDVTPDGRAWIKFGYKYKYWQMYREVFEHIRVAGRAQMVDKPGEEDEEVTGEGVSFVSLPYYLGPEQYVKNFRKVNAAVEELVQEPGAYFLRIPSMLSRPAIRGLHGRPFGAFVVGDPYEVGKSLDHWAKAFFRRITARDLRHACKKASALAYVTERILQEKYPGSAGVFTTHYSDVGMVPAAYVTRPKEFSGNKPAVLSFVGTLDALYKGQKELLTAAAQLIGQKLVSRVIVVGGGRYQSELETLAKSLGIRSQVEFCGTLRTPEAVREALDGTDLFVLPSYTEGLPRATVEAMARGLPCVCSRVGGLLEIVEDGYLVPPHDASALAEKIASVLRDPAGMNRAAARNLEKARTYSADEMHRRRLEFLRVLRDLTMASERGGS